MQDFDAKTRYALLAALDLAEHYQPGKPVKIRDIAARTGTPAKYLVHILLQLKRAALVNSTRGAKGGYWLLRRPALISVAEVVAAVETHRGRPPAPSSESPYDGAISRLSRDAQRQAQGFLAQVTLEA
ncbi:MAG: Rrf2 family transcriptional regulator, partial [Planctomycetota bacterium]